ncbi:hypothetical protein JXA48_03195 [Candidatus Woesearchaeota archaeon]|nr:hypothetical protein [Candidatus Woesearchaeota archaeon]
MVLKQLKTRFSKPKLDIRVKHGKDNSYILNTIHADNKIEFTSHYPVKSVFPLPTESAVTLHNQDLVHSHHLRIERENGDVLKIFECPKKSFVVVELVKKPYFSLIIARSGNDLVVDGVDYSKDASNLLLKKYVSLFNKYKKLLHVNSYSKTERNYSIEI